METTESLKGIPDDPKERLALAERIAEDVRALRQQLDEVQPGPTRKAQRHRLLLMIQVRRWKMGLLNPKRYGKKPKSFTLY